MISYDIIKDEIVIENLTLISNKLSIIKWSFGPKLLVQDCVFIDSKPKWFYIKYLIHELWVTLWK